MQWFVVGGWSMWFLLVLGGLSVLAAGKFAFRPDETQLPRIAALSRSVGWSILVGVSSDLAAVGFTIPSKPEWAHSPDLPLIVLEGFAESMSPAIFGGAILSVISILLAAGHARLRIHGSAP
ncbi:MAG TPA: hypothetical protein VK509_20050 [Polyangiales bacterium]|nr:hypothetical protein [Polyangiales bacterium]